MPLLNSLATPYAEALLQVTEARGESETVADQCKQLLEIWNDSEDFRDAMVSPVLEPDAKKQALKALVGEQVTPSVLNLLKVLADRQRLLAFDAVMLRYLELYREQQGITASKARSRCRSAKTLRRLRTDGLTCSPTRALRACFLASGSRTGDTMASRKSSESFQIASSCLH